MAIVLTMVAGQTVSAQQATPGSGSVEFPITPGPEECTVAPLTEGELMARVDAVAQPGTAGAQAEPGGGDTGDEEAIPEGEPVDDETVAAITATTRELIACSNAGNQLRFFALTTDTLFGQLFGPGPIAADDVAAIQEVVEIPEDAYISLLGVSEARELPDGRVGALSESGPLDGESTVDFLIFVEQDGRWVVDERRQSPAEQ